MAGLDNKMLTELAEAILTTIVGHGWWVPFERFKSGQRPSDPVMGVEVGDVLYWVDRDGDYCSHQVEYINQHGEAFYVDEDREGNCRLCPMEGPMYPTEQEAYQAIAEEMTADNIKHLRELLAACDARKE